MMNIERYAEGTNFCTGLCYGDLVFLSGEASEADVSGIKAKSEDLFRILDEELAACGSDKAHILAATCYFDDLERDFAGFNEAWQAWFGDTPKPTRSCVEVDLIDESWLVEITLIAAKVK